MSLPPEVIGRIILAKFLSYSVKRYEKTLNEVEDSRIFRSLFSHMTTFEMFRRAKVATDKEGFTQTTLGKIEQDGQGFCICYRHPGFAGEYHLDREKLTRLIQSGNFPECRKDEIDLLERKLRLISTRNKVTHMTLLGIVEHQVAYLRSSDLLDLVPLSQVKLSHWIKGQGYQSIDNSVISRIVNGTSILTPDGKLILLKDFFPSARKTYKAYIKEILTEEERELKSNRLNRPYTDEQIREKLQKTYALSISRRSVTYCRNQIGIPPFRNRTYDNQYPPRWAHFSAYFPLTLSSVKENAPQLSGLYELSAEQSNIEYPSGAAPVFYLGSSNNIRKRLRVHLGPGCKNGHLDAFINGSKCFFRFVVSNDGFRQEEKRLLRCFSEMYAARPKCNRIG